MTICYHNQDVNSIAHNSVLANVAKSGSFVWSNQLPNSIWLQILSLSPVGGIPNVSLSIASKYWSQDQDGKPTAFNVNSVYTFGAYTESQEIEIPSGKTINLQENGSSAVDIAIVVAWGI